MKTCVNSEFGKLEGVIIHQPGSEVENMTPENAERALYSDILNLSIASREYDQLAGVLNKVTEVFQIKELLLEILKEEEVRSKLLKEICLQEGIAGKEMELASNRPDLLADLLIEGVVLEKNNLTNYLSNERFLLRPLHNLFFTRDSAMGMNNNMVIGKMANPVRERETLIMDAIFRYHPQIETSIINPTLDSTGSQKGITLEGGDFQVAREDVLVIGTGIRTSTQGIDFIIDNIKKVQSGPMHIIVQELPSSPESFIHLDMVFTFLDYDACMIYPPVVTRMNRLKTIHITIENQQVTKIEEMPNIPSALKNLGMDLEPIVCGGRDDSWMQEREQWHSGANFLAFAPGKVIGYERNNNTIEELNKKGYAILKAKDIIEERISVDDHNKCVVVIAGSELARGGGGARCMTMPVKRAAVNW